MTGGGMMTATRWPRLAAPALACLLVACTSGSKAQGRPPSAAQGPAATTVAPTTTTTTPPYTVARGDTLTKIARRFNVDVAALASANHLTNLNQITPGQVLVIPAPKPVTLVIRPAKAVLGSVFTFNLTGAKADELILFEVLRPDGGKFVGQPHVAHPDGTVSTTYLTVFGDALGQYKVLAAGNEGTVAHTAFEVTAPPTATTSGG
jgi:LysM repeat protein